MNERIKELAFEAGMHYRELCDEFCAANTDGVPFEMMERFAELVRQDERDKCAQDYLQDCCNAIAVAEHNEREACAKLCEEQDEYGCGQYAKAIRARGQK